MALRFRVRLTSPAEVPHVSPVGAQTRFDQQDAGTTVKGIPGNLPCVTPERDYSIVGNLSRHLLIGQYRNPARVIHVVVRESTCIVIYRYESRNTSPTGRARELHSRSLGHWRIWFADLGN